MSFTRIGAAALFAGLALHIVANFVLKQPPPIGMSQDELATYLSAEAATWKVVHGMRYLAVACLAVFYAALFTWTRGPAEKPGGWAVLGLIGAVLHLANLLIANGIEMLAFLDFDMLSRRPELFWLLYGAGRALFNAEITTWAIALLGFSAAGWAGGAIPRPIAALGFFAAATGLAAGAMTALIMTSTGWPGYVLEAASLSSLIWFVLTAGWMLLKRHAR